MISPLDVQGVAWDSWGVNGDYQKVPDFVDDGAIWRSLNGNTVVNRMVDSKGFGNVVADYHLELSECPCDPRRRHERLGQKVAVV